MQLYYCDRCGLRVSDEEIASGLARRKDENSYICAKCSTEAPAPRKPPSGSAARPEAPSSGQIVVPRHALAQQRKSGAVILPPRPHVDERRGSGSEDRVPVRRHSTPPQKSDKAAGTESHSIVYMLGAAGAALVLIGIALMSGSRSTETNSRSTREQDSKVQDPAPSTATSRFPAQVSQQPQPAATAPRPGWMPDAPKEVSKNTERKTEPSREVARPAERKPEAPKEAPKPVEKLAEKKAEPAINATPAPASAGADCPNLIHDPGFELGNLSSWEKWGNASLTTTQVRSGKFAGELTSSTGLAKTLKNLTPNTTYEASAWIRADPNTWLTFATKGHQPQDVKVIVQGCEYKEHAFTFTTGPQQTSITVYAWNSAQGKTANVDDWALIKKEQKK
ncbi:MAG TPA: carbohydrate binding domain-containing protein [Planctomycetota bacterium]|nr:carbohydrate binding domain-containing protein [Planctomycetota bacterium]